MRCSSCSPPNCSPSCSSGVEGQTHAEQLNRISSSVAPLRKKKSSLTCACARSVLPWLPSLLLPFSLGGIKAQHSLRRSWSKVCVRMRASSFVALSTVPTSHHCSRSNRDGCWTWAQTTITTSGQVKHSSCCAHQRVTAVRMRHCVCLFAMDSGLERSMADGTRLLFSVFWPSFCAL